MPCYTLENVDKQRGNGVFDRSIKALQTLNELGYGKEGSGKTIPPNSDLVLYIDVVAVHPKQ